GCSTLPVLYSFPTRRSSDLDAFVSGAVRDERNAGGDSGHSGALSLLASAEERGTSRIAVCLAWSSPWRDDPDEGDRYFAAANRQDRKSTRLNSSHQIISYAV